MQNTARSDKIRKILRKTYPEVKTQLRHRNPFELLVATILSAQCTDKQVKIEFDLMKIIPKQAWNDFSLYLIYFGRQYCSARNPKCPSCPVNRLCNWPDKKI